MHVLAETGQTMTSQEIAELCEARHNDVVASIARLYEQGVLRDRRKTPREHQPLGGGRPTLVYDLSYRDCMVVVSGYRPEVRAKIIDRWMELEKAATPTLPQTFAQALRLAAEQAETIEQQAAQLAVAVPALEFVNKYVEASSGSKRFREVCKLLGAKENSFWEFLEAGKIMYRLRKRQTPYACHIDAGRFEVTTGVNDQGHAFTNTLFTAKGINWIAGEWAKYQIKDKT